MVAVVVITSIVGVGYLVASHADTGCSGVSNPTSSGTSTPILGCVPVSVPGDTGTDPGTYDPVPSEPDVSVPDAINVITNTQEPALRTTAKCTVAGVPAKPIGKRA